MILILILILTIQSKIKSAPFTPIRESFPRKRGKRKHEFKIAASIAVPSPAQRGKVPKAEGGRLLILILALQGKINSAPFSPIRGSFPRCAGEATARVSGRHVNRCPFPCEAGKVGRRPGRGRAFAQMRVERLDFT